MAGLACQSQQWSPTIPVYCKNGSPSPTFSHSALHSYTQQEGLVMPLNWPPFCLDIQVLPGHPRLDVSTSIPWLLMVVHKFECQCCFQWVVLWRSLLWQDLTGALHTFSLLWAFKWRVVWHAPVIMQCGCIPSHLTLSHPITSAFFQVAKIYWFHLAEKYSPLLVFVFH